MRAFLLALAITPHIGTAQSWCPPGATWVHDYADHMFNGGFGVTRVVYEGDSFVGGFTAQKLRETNVIAPWGSTQYASQTNSIPILTRYEDDVVYLWNWNNVFDTLMWFSATPGQYWQAPGLDDPFARITVLDTSTVVIDGEPLRQLIVEFGDWEGIPADTLRERLGYSFNYLNGWSWFLTDMPWAGLRCYRDEEISFSAAGVTDCGFTLSIGDAVDNSAPVLFPNPGTTHFTVTPPPGPHTISLVDAIGREVLHLRASEQRQVISTAHLVPGLYMVRVDDQAPLRWVKE
ncbi:MAG: T9SS type A sorting domain-containing protein [Flavobacteriales bacterium]|nr:T9SS type A sorting domain-containing protein [Flavobacteriales bacterium]